MEKVKEFLRENYNTTIEEVEINQLQDAIDCTNELHAMTGDEEYIDINYELHNILEKRMEIEDNKIISELEQQVE